MVCAMVFRAEPTDGERLVIVVMMRLGLAAADLTAAPLDLTAADIDMKVGAGIGALSSIALEGI